MNQKEVQFRELIEENQNRFYRICRVYAYKASDLDDLYQEVLIQIWQSLDKFREEAALNTFIYRIAINTALNFNKKQKKNKIQSLETIPNTLLKTENDSKEEISDEMIIELYQQIQNLKEEEKSLILLHLEGLSYQEMASVTGYSVNLVGVKLNRIKKRLAKKLKNYTK